MGSAREFGSLALPFGYGENIVKSIPQVIFWFSKKKNDASDRNRLLDTFL